MKIADRVAAIARGECADPFSILGPHASGRSWTVRCMVPGAGSVQVIARDGAVLADARVVDRAGVSEARIDAPRVAYRLRVREGDSWHEREDPYRFTSLLGEFDRHLIGEGNHQRLYDALGARACDNDGIPLPPRLPPDAAPVEDSLPMVGA